MRARSALFALCGVFHLGVIPCNKLQHICHNENSTVFFSCLFFFCFLVCLFVCFLQQILVTLPEKGSIQQPQEWHYPFLPVCAVFLCVRTMVWLPVFAIFNMCTDADACDCTWRLYEHHKRVCNDRRLWDKNPLLQRETKLVSIPHLAFQSHTPCHLSYPPREAGSNCEMRT